MKMNIKGKLYAGFGTIVLFLLVLAVLLAVKIGRFREANAQYHVQNEKVRIIRDAQMEVTEIRDFAMDTGLTLDYETYRAKTEKSNAKVNGYLEQYAAIEQNAEDTAEFFILKEELKELSNHQRKIYDAFKENREKGVEEMHHYDNEYKVMISKLGEFSTKQFNVANSMVARMFTMAVNGIMTAVTVVVLVIIASALIAFALSRKITRPLMRVVEVAKSIAGGNLSHKELDIESNDEIGQLAEAFNKMLAEFNNLVMRAELIANGVIGTEEVEEKIRMGQSLEEASAITGKDKRGDLEDAFDRMQAELRKLAVQARRIAADDLNNPVLDIGIPGELGEAFTQMTLALRNLAAVAERLSEGDISVQVENKDGSGVLAGSFAKVVRCSEELAQNVRQITEGDLTVAINIRSDKDVLANALALMAANLKNLITKVHEQAGLVTNSSATLAQVSEQSNHTISQLSSIVTQISSATVSVAQNSQSASSASQSADSISREGKELMIKLVNKIAIIKSMAETSAVAMNGLSSRSAQIGDIVNVITKIADQTNLLSLNAAIEAARAGEAGRGFAVVADEVRKLAENSARSALEISKIINEVQEETKEAAQSVQKGQREIEDGAQLTRQASARFTDIVAQVGSIAHQVEQIAAAAEETAASAQESSASSEEQTAAIQEIAASAAQLSNTAQVLQGAIGKFKVQ